MADETSHQKEKSEPFFKCDVISLNPPRYRFTCLLAGYGLKGNNNCCRDKERVFQTESDKPRYDNLYRHLHTHTNGDFGVILKTFIESLNISHKTGLLTILSRISIRPHTPLDFRSHLDFPQSVPWLLCALKANKPFKTFAPGSEPYLLHAIQLYCPGFSSRGLKDRSLANALPGVANLLRLYVADLLKNIPSLALTADGWTATYKRNKLATPGSALARERSVYRPQAFR